MEWNSLAQGCSDSRWEVSLKVGIWGEMCESGWLLPQHNCSSFSIVDNTLLIWQCSLPGNPFILAVTSRIMKIKNFKYWQTLRYYLEVKGFPLCFILMILSFLYLNEGSCKCMWKMYVVLGTKKTNCSRRIEIQVWNSLKWKQKNNWKQMLGSR